MDALALRPLRLLATVFALALGLALVAAAPATAQLPPPLDELPIPPDGEEEPGDEDPDEEDPLDEGDGPEDDGGNDDPQVTQTPEGGVASGLGGTSGPPAAAAVALALTLALLAGAALTLQRRPALLPWDKRS